MSDRPLPQLSKHSAKHQRKDFLRFTYAVNHRRRMTQKGVHKNSVDDAASVVHQTHSV
jgi:hypothetical protein